MSKKSEKKGNNYRIKPRKVRGFEDMYAHDVASFFRMQECLRDYYRFYGFDDLYTPAIEYSDVLGKFLPDDDRPNAGVFSFQDDADQWVSLRYDLTAALARYVAENYDHLPKPFRRQQVGSVWRNEKPGPGRLREFVQCDIDIIGSTSMASDTEVIIVAARALETLGLAPEQYRVGVNNRKMLDSLLMRIFPSHDLCELDAQKTIILRAMDKLDRLGMDAVTLLLGEGRKDESGDFTKGAALNTSQIDIVVEFLTITDGVKNRQSALETLHNLAGKNSLGEQAWQEFHTIDTLLTAMKIPDWQVQFDTSIVRGLDYYTGPVFEAELLTQIDDKKDSSSIVGSVGGGGRYDGLVSRFKNEIIPGVGFSIGLTRLFYALKAHKNSFQDKSQIPVVIIVLNPEYMADYFTLADMLRKAGIITDIYMGQGGLRAQMKYADRRKARFAVIEGEDERKKGVVTVKDLYRGASLSQSISDNIEWRQSQEAQIEISKELLVSYLRDRIKYNKS